MASSSTLTEADIPDVPPSLDPPVRSDFPDDETGESAYQLKLSKHNAAKAERAEKMKERRRIQERLRQQRRESSRVRDPNDSERRVAQRQQNHVAAEQHRQREAARYKPVAQPEPSTADMHLRSVDTKHFCSIL